MIPNWSEEEFEMFATATSEKEVVFVNSEGEEDKDCLRDIIHSDLKETFTPIELVNSLYADMESGMKVEEVFDKYLTNGH